MNQALLLSVLALTASCLHAQDKAALKRISSVFETVEENYKYWPHHSITGENLEGGYAFEHHVWQSNDEPPLYRVESLSFDDHGQAKKQFFFKGSQLLFVLDRSEMTPMQEKAATSVVEKRLYFAEGSLIRMLEKAGKFPEGKPTDTTSLKNKDTPVEEVLGAGELYGELEREAQAIMVKVNKISSDDAPAAPTTELSIFGDGWRLIRGSQSRNGQYALAWGIQGKSMPEGETDEDGALSANDPEAEGLTNYAINLKTGVFLGKTNGAHASDKTNSGHYTHEVAWSSASNYFVQICSGKWATFSASFYKISPVDEALSEPIDILEMAKKAAFSNLEGGDILKKFDKDDFTTTLHDVKIAQRGSKTFVVVEVAGQIPKSEEEGAYFNLTLTFQLMPDENGGRSQLQWTGTESHYD